MSSKEAHYSTENTWRDHAGQIPLDLKVRILGLGDRQKLAQGHAKSMQGHIKSMVELGWSPETSDPSVTRPPLGCVAPWVTQVCVWWAGGEQ